MTEKTLEKAIEIKQIIDNLRYKKQELEETSNLCCGNTNEVRARTFQVSISENGCYKKTTLVSSQAVKRAIEYEISGVDERLEKNLNILSKLN